jgi:hypothetical protein
MPRASGGKRQRFCCPAYRRALVSALPCDAAGCFTPIEEADGSIITVADRAVHEHPRAPWTTTGNRPPKPQGFYGLRGRMNGPPVPVPVKEFHGKAH